VFVTDVWNAATGCWAKPADCSFVGAKVSLSVAVDATVEVVLVVAADI
jgi:hypothetical protein